MAQGWIVKRGEKSRGPFTSKQLKKLADSGQLKPTDLIRQAEGGKFVLATKVKGLFPEAAASKAASKTAPASAAAPAAVPKAPRNAERKIEPKVRPKAAPPADDFADAVEVVEYADVDDEDYEEAVPVADDFADEFADDYEDDYEEPDPPPRRGRRPPSSGRPSGKRRPPSVAKKEPPAKSRSSAKAKGKKKAAEDDDGENPWANLAWGVGSLALGLILFFTAMNAESSGEEIDFGRRGGLFKLIYNILGKWGVLAFFVVVSLLFFGTCIQKWSKKR